MRNFNHDKPGTLHVVATPIGNLGDISPRAVRTLQSVDLVLAEDTRHLAKLLNHLGISQKTAAFHEHNEKAQLEAMLDKLQNGFNLALTSDAGTPLISDPGYRLVDAVLSAGLQVVALPGPCALIAALSISGMPTDKFHFDGFLPAKPGPRQSRINDLAKLSGTWVAYESPHRIVSFLEDVIKVLGDSYQLCLVKEISKLHENVLRDEACALLTRLTETPELSRGEWVVVGHNAAKLSTESVSDEAKRIFHLLNNHLAAKDAAKLAAKITGESKNKIYESSKKSS